MEKRFCRHAMSSKYETSEFYKAMRQFGVDNFKIEVIRTFPFTVGTSIHTKRRKMLELETEEIAKYKPTELFNATIADSITKRQLTSQKHTIEEKKLASARQRSTAGHRGCIQQVKNRWKFVWTIDKVRRSKSFQTYEELIVHQDLIYPKRKALVIDAKKSVVYKLENPFLDQIRKDPREYIGETEQTLPARDGKHRAFARRANNEFYRYMATTNPLQWTCTPIHILYNASKLERLAVEAIEISKIPPKLLWNHVPHNLRLEQFWTCTKKTFAFGGTKTSDQAKQEAIAWGIANRGKMCNVAGCQRWIVHITFGGNTHTQAFSFDSHVSGDSDRAKDAANVWLAAKKAERMKYWQKLATRALKRSAKIVAAAKVKAGMS